MLLEVLFFCFFLFVIRLLMTMTMDMLLFVCCDGIIMSFGPPGCPLTICGACIILLFFIFLLTRTLLESNSSG